MIATALLAGLLAVACGFGVLYFGMGEVGPGWLVPALFALCVLCAAWFVVGMLLGMLGIGPELHAELSWE